MGELVDRDQEHLGLLKVGFYIMAGTCGFFTLFSLLYIGIGALVSSGIFPAPQGSSDNPRAVGFFFVGIGLAFFLVGLIITLLTYFAGRSIRGRRHRVFCMIMAGLWCFAMPFGTAIGICAILVLNRPSVELLFKAQGVPAITPSADAT